MSPELQEAVRDDVLTPPPSPSPSEHSAKPSDSSLSVCFIEEHFIRSRGLLTIGSIIEKTGDKDLARERFVALMSALKATESGFKRSFAWALDMSGVQWAASVDQDKLALLKYCLDGLQGDLETWVAERAIFLVALPDSRSKRTKVSGFFGDMAADPRWSRFEAITVLQHASQPRRLTFSGHAANAGGRARWSPLESCEVRHVRYGKRNRCYSVIRAIFRIRRSPNPDTLDQRQIDELEESGLTFFSFEKFLEFAGNYNAEAA